MASPANNNSSSSPPIPCRPNPKPRNSEATDPMRRSFGGNPFPAKSRVTISSDVSRRNSVGRENSQIEFTDKENETKASKGSKNFMSPTISAVSKINASPRKKVLSDRNEMSRSSEVKGLILEHTKSHHQAKSCVSFSDVIKVISIDEKKQLEESNDMTITDFDENEVYENNGVAKFDSRFRISPLPSVPYTSPEYAAREVDPLLLPYDPKKNYLSPRPQFLHYKPNPRIEKSFDECKQLDELFISESSCSDTESEKCEEQEMVAVVVEEETEDVEQLEAESDDEMVSESIVQEQSGFRKLKFFGWFLAMALGYMLVSATLSSSNEISILKDSPFYEEIREFAKANNLEQLSEKLWTLTESSVVYIDKLISRLGGGEEDYVPLQFYNLTDILEDYTFIQPTRVEISEVPLQEKSRCENNLEDEDDVVNEFEEESGEEESSEEDDAETEIDEQTEIKHGNKIELSEGEGNFEALFEDGMECNIKEQRESEMNPEEGIDSRGSESDEKLETESTTKFQDELEEAESESRGKDSQERLETASTKVDQEELEKAEFEAININQHDVESGSEEEIAAETSDESSNKTDTDSDKVMIIALSSTVLVLLAAIAFFFTKDAKPVAASAPEQGPETTEELNVGHVTVENLMKEKLSSLNFEAEVDDNNNKNKNKEDTKEQHQSSSSKLRRESMASSASEYSIDSFSYGSFTTYEKIPIKSGGDREEEIITPVRRSSRLRNHNQSSSGL